VVVCDADLGANLAIRGERNPACAISVLKPEDFEAALKGTGSEENSDKHAAEAKQVRILRGKGEVHVDANERMSQTELRQGLKEALHEPPGEVTDAVEAQVVAHVFFEVPRQVSLY